MSDGLRWSAQNAYDDVIATAAAHHGVAVVLIKAVIGQESAFDPNAYRAEPQLNDASRGLMQLLLGTAHGLGYTGDAQGLYDPTTNVELGAKLLKQNLDRGGSVDSALSAYNGGFRPQLGYGAPLANGQFRNQAYVDGVREKIRYFAGLVQATPESQVDEAAIVNAPSSPASLIAVGLVAILAALLALRGFFGGH